MGKLLFVLLALGIGLAGAGYWNYERNAHLDAELEQRPYGKLSAEEIELLIEAYRAERAKYAQQLELVGQRQDPMQAYAPEDLSGKLQGFDRVQRNAAQYKDVHRKMLEQEVEIERLEREKATRAQGLDDEWNRVWRRVATF